MKKLPIRIMSAAMVASIMLSAAACSNGQGGSGISSGLSGLAGTSTDQKRSGVKISADSPWFEATSFNVGINYDTSRPIDYTYQRMAGIDKDKFLVITNGYYKTDGISDADMMNGNFNYDEYRFQYLDVIDRSTGKSINTIDLSKIISENDYIEDVQLNAGKIVCNVTSFDMNTYESIGKIVELDASTGAVIDTRKSDSQIAFERSFKFGDYTVQTEMDWTGEEGAYKIHVVSPDGSRETMDLKERGTNYYDIPLMLPLSETMVLIPVRTDSNWKYFELDLKAAKLSETDGKNYEWLDLENVYDPYFSDSGEIFYAGSTGVFRINLKDKAIEKVFDFSWCDVNRNKLAYLQIADISDGHIVLCGENYNSSPYESSDNAEFVYYDFSKAETNPHAGKTVLELYQSWGYTEDKVSDAILRFNQTNSEYFIEVTDRYKEDNSTEAFNNAESDDDYKNAQLNLDKKLSNELAMDLMNGDGPDILMSVSQYGQLNNSNYLTDLTPYVGNLDSNKYFTNILEASKVDGKLYNLPICFGISGIQTDPKYAGASGVGFTTEEYEKFLKETLNGKDVLNNGQAVYFATLFNAMSDKFIVDGKVDFSSPEFAKLAEFVKNNVSPVGKTWDELYNAEYDDYTYASVGVGATVYKGDTFVNAEYDALFTQCYGMTYYFSNAVQTKGGTAIYGLPSADGRGPSIECYISVAISAQAENTEACAEFVKLLLSDDVQTDFAMKDNFVLSREAFRQGAEKAVEYFNDYGYSNYFGEDAAASKNRIVFGSEHIDAVENIILSCSTINTADADINIILIEEMPAYFSGQKDLDAVVAIAQDRVQKVIGERG